MSNYTITTNFDIKDGLLSGNPEKIIRGSEINSEFTAISTAVNSKANTESPTFTGTVSIDNLTVTGITTLTTVDGGTY